MTRRPPKPRGHTLLDSPEDVAELAFTTRNILVRANGYDTVTTDAGKFCAWVDVAVAS